MCIPSVSNFRGKNRKSFEKTLRNSLNAFANKFRVTFIFWVHYGWDKFVSYLGIHINIKRQSASRMRKQKRNNCTSFTFQLRRSATFLHGCYMWLINVHGLLIRVDKIPRDIKHRNELVHSAKYTHKILQSINTLSRHNGSK